MVITFIIRLPVSRDRYSSSLFFHSHVTIRSDQKIQTRSESSRIISRLAFVTSLEIRVLHVKKNCLIISFHFLLIPVFTSTRQHISLGSRYPSTTLLHSVVTPNTIGVSVWKLFSQHPVTLPIIFTLLRYQSLCIYSAHGKVTWLINRKVFWKKRPHPNLNTIPIFTRRE